LARQDLEMAGHSATETATLDRVISIFRRFDSNGDGTIECEEFATVLRKLGPEGAWSDNNIRCLMECADTNGDGRIELTEFLRWVFQVDDDHTAAFWGSVARPGGSGLADVEVARRALLDALAELQHLPAQDFQHAAELSALAAARDPLLEAVVAAVCEVLGRKGHGRAELLHGRAQLLEDLTTLGAEVASAGSARKILQQLEPFILDKGFKPAATKSASSLAASLSRPLCTWCRALYTYCQILEGQSAAPEGVIDKDLVGTYMLHSRRRCGQESFMDESVELCSDGTCAHDLTIVHGGAGRETLRKVGRWSAKDDAVVMTWTSGTNDGIGLMVPQSPMCGFPRTVKYLRSDLKPT